MSELLLEMERRYMEMMIAQREEIGMLKERLLWLERRCGFSPDRGCQVLEIPQSRSAREQLYHQPGAMAAALRGLCMRAKLGKEGV